MAATILIHQMTTDANTGVNKTASTIRMKSVPSTAPNGTDIDTNDPLIKPGAGTIYSYVVKIRAYMDVPPDTQVDDFEWYSDGSNNFGTGIGCEIKNVGNTFGTYYDTAMVGGADFFSYTSGAALNGVQTNTGPFTPADDNTYIADIIEMQISVASTATNGALPPEQLTLAWNEI